MNWSFHPEAEEEFLEAINYYEECRTGLGYEFALEVYAALQRIITHPLAWPILEGDLRRSRMNRFPYGVLYAQEGEDIYVLAVMHLHRDPDYWRSQLA